MFLFPLFSLFGASAEVNSTWLLFVLQLLFSFFGFSIFTPSILALIVGFVPFGIFIILIAFIFQQK